MRGIGLLKLWVNLWRFSCTRAPKPFPPQTLSAIHSQPETVTKQFNHKHSGPALAAETQTAAVLRCFIGNTNKTLHHMTHIWSSSADTFSFSTPNKLWVHCLFLHPHPPTEETGCGGIRLAQLLLHPSLPMWEGGARKGAKRKQEITKWGNYFTIWGTYWIPRKRKGGVFSLWPMLSCINFWDFKRLPFLYKHALLVLPIILCLTATAPLGESTENMFRLSL